MSQDPRTVTAAAANQRLVGGIGAAVVGGEQAAAWLAIAVALVALVCLMATRRRPDIHLQAALEASLAAAVERLQRDAARGSGELESKKQLIDQQLAVMTGELQRVTRLIGSLERDRAERHGELAAQLRAASEQTTHLTETTAALREALVSARARGQWGERMAEDVLRLAGFVENVNYRKQTALADGRGVPDFTFLLPRDLVLHMDVKFPLDNYLRCLDARSDSERARYRASFLRDVRQRLRELSERRYIDPATTVDCVLLFLPNEQLYAFIHEHDGALLDEAVRRKVVVCSPVTLFAVLAVIRQALDHFALERRSREILDALCAFGEQWSRYTEQMDKLGTHLDRAQRSYDELVRTRRRQLEGPLERLDELRRQSPAGVPAAGGPSARLPTPGPLPEVTGPR